MRKIISKLSVVAMFLIAACSFAFAASNVTKTYDHLGSFKGLEVGGSFEVELIQGDTYKVTVIVPDDYAPYLDVEVDDGILEVGFKDLPTGKRMRRAANNFILQVQMPELRTLDLSGAAKCTAAGLFTTVMGKIEIELDGASSLDGLSVKAAEIEVETSGASRANVTVDAANLQAKSEGASKLTLSGGTVDARYEVSGASTMSTENVKADNVFVKQGGASKLTLKADITLDVNIKGSSKCVYYAGPEMTMKGVNVSGASVLKKAN